MNIAVKFNLTFMRLCILGILLSFLAQSAFSQEQNIQSLLDQYALENGFNGTILIRKQEETLYHNSFGLANREQNIPNTNETQYAIASITKLFTSVIILQLVTQGKIDLDKAIIDYLPDYGGSVGDQVSVHHLLIHTSGIQNCEEVHTDSTNLPDIYLDEISTDEILRKYCSGPQTAKVGSTFNYNNGDYIILGKIIEKVSNNSYQNVLKHRILVPLKMDETGLIVTTEDIQNLAQGYKWNDEQKLFKKDPKRLFQNYYSAGAMYSSAEDLMKFSTALFNGTLLDDHAMKMLVRTYPETKSYGYGLWVRYPKYNKTVPKVAQRFGQIWGINTLISQFIDHDITVIVLANSDKVNVSEFQNIIGEKLLD